MLARVVLRTNRLSSGGPLLNELHWLPVASRIQFKIATLTHKILSTGTPSYLSSLLSHYKPTRQLRSSSSNLLVQPPSKLDLALLHFTPLHLWSGMACQPMSGHHLPFRPSRKCSKLIIFAALPSRSRASPAPQIRFDWFTRTLSLWPWRVFQIVIIIIIYFRKIGASTHLSTGTYFHFEWERKKMVTTLKVILVIMRCPHKNHELTSWEVIKKSSILSQVKPMTLIAIQFIYLWNGFLYFRKCSYSCVSSTMLFLPIHVPRTAPPSMHSRSRRKLCSMFDRTKNMGDMRRTEWWESLKFGTLIWAQVQIITRLTFIYLFSDYHFI